MSETSDRPEWTKFELGHSDAWLERDIQFYENFFDIKKEDLRDKKILDLGSSKSELFSRRLNQLGLNTDVVSLNPDYTLEAARQYVKDKDFYTKKSVAGTGQELPFKDESFDYVFALYSLSAYSTLPEMVQKWSEEEVRVLKKGGQAKIAPFIMLKGSTDSRINDVSAALSSQGVTLVVERIDILPEHEKSVRDNSNLEFYRIVIKKPKYD